jgi:SAM-dependent methyltransferase
MTRLSPETEALVRCPHCHAALPRSGDNYVCANTVCGRTFPVAAGDIPVLIDEEQSVFSIETFVRRQPTFFYDSGRVATLLKKFVPNIGANLRSRPNYRSLRDRLIVRGTRPRVLVLGGSILGYGMEALDTPEIELVETDVALGPRTKLICDAHSIPFEDQSFDAVIAQAVLEHVLDPFRCVAEIHRVLKADGWVYAETPFMQQVHGGAYDFLRFSYLGYLRLFRNFERVDSGAVAGPGTALAWSYEFFLLSFVRSRVMRNVIKAFARFSAFPLKYFDHLVIDRPAAYDAASGFYFLGRRSERVLPDRDLLTMYQGGG